MVTVTIGNKGIAQQNAKCLAFVVEQDFAFSSELKSLAETYFPALEDAMKSREFTGKAGSSLAVCGSSGDRIIDLMLVGIGKKGDSSNIDIEQYRRALGRIVRGAESRKNKSVAIQLPDAALFGVDNHELAKQTAIALHMADYHFDEFITDDARKISCVSDIILVGDNVDASGVETGNIVAEYVNTCRHWIDLPPGKLTPPHLADEAEKLSKKNGLKVKIFNEPEIKQMGMGGLAGVSSGSHQDCKLVVLEYDCGDKDAQTIAFVGKGITFDSGGLSLKPPAYMETMKEDMSGAAAVISAMQVVAKLKPKVNVVAFAPLSENLPSGTATKPGDILTFYNGKTAEVKNTDAEGRLVLADALSYAVKHYKLDAMIDLATLTGACAYALGPFFTGLMSQHPDFASKVKDAAKRSGDRVWELPFNDDYKPAIKSAVADISNIGSKRYMAGAITAGFFLQNFVEDVPWVHLDIAGTAFDVPDISYYRPESATGAGVRLLVELAMNWK